MRKLSRRFLFGKTFESPGLHADTIRPGLPSAHQLLQLLRLRGGEVVEFRAVGVQVVELLIGICFLDAPRFNRLMGVLREAHLFLTYEQLDQRVAANRPERRTRKLFLSVIIIVLICTERNLLSERTVRLFLRAFSQRRIDERFFLSHACPLPTFRPETDRRRPLRCAPHRRAHKVKGSVLDNGCLRRTAVQIAFA